MRLFSRSQMSLAFVILLAFATSATAQDRIGEALKLDHFKFYKVEPVKTEASVSLKGQFDRDNVPARLPSINYLANPVSKDGGKIINPFAHLTWYALAQRLQEPRRAVEFENQFGRQEALLGKPVALLAPTEKVEKGSKFPEGVDHYKVYVALEVRPSERKVTLKDQFGAEEGVVIGKATYFALPVMKQHDNTVTKITNEKGHLTFYEIVRKTPNKLRKDTVDQFGKHTLAIIQSEMLALPTIKIAWKAIED